MDLDISQTLRKAVIAQQDGKYDEAILYYEKIIEVKSSHVVAHNNMGIIMRQLGRFQEAIIYFEKVTVFKPDLAEAHYNLGKVFQILRRFKESVECYKRAIILEPNLTEGFINLGAILCQLNILNESFEIEKVFMTTNKDERYKLYQQMDSLIIEDAPIVPLYYDQFVRFTQKNIRGLTTNPINLLNLKKVSKDQE